MRVKQFVCAAMLAVFFYSAASSAPLVVSTFNANREGWTTTFGTTVGPGTIWQSTGGNLGGNLVAPDASTGTLTWNFSASPDTPSSPLLGNHLNAYGGSLEYDLKIDNYSGTYYNTANDFDVWLVGGGLTLLYDGSFQPNGSWTHFSVPLVASAGWRKNLFFPATSAATEAELQTALANITNIQIRGNYTETITTTRMDNVGFYNIPEPSLCLLGGVGLIGLALVWRRRMITK